MRRFAMLSALALVLSTPLSAQTQAPAQKARFIPPVKGTASIEVMQSTPKRVGGDMVTLVKVRNTSKGSINLLKIDEYWYDASRPVQIVSSSQYAHRKAPILPNDVVEITVKSPYHAKMRQNQMMFTHANGTVDAKAVKAFK
ncbi:MAG TPA: hypothetical protein VNJ03_00140 [Vicinamibacterales bacterium]|nr:hypothetical protein [Vicinamibacterales bacterium]